MKAPAVNAEGSENAKITSSVVVVIPGLSSCQAAFSCDSMLETQLGSKFSVPIMIFGTSVTFFSLALAVAATRIHNGAPDCDIFCFQLAHSRLICAPTLVEGHGCLAVRENRDGAMVTIEDCRLGDIKDKPDTVHFDWEVAFSKNELSSSKQQIRVYGDKCLEFITDTAQIGTCDESNTNTRQQWIARPDFSLEWAGAASGQCLDLRDHEASFGTPAVVSLCSAHTTQDWAAAPMTKPGIWLTSFDSNEKGTPYCMAASSQDDQAPVALVRCTALRELYPTGSVTWTVPAIPFSGYIRTPNDKCLTARFRTEGGRLTVEACPARTGVNSNQRFVPLHDGRFQLEGTNFCVDLTDGQPLVGNPLQISGCDGTPNQIWTRVERIRRLPSY
ncbi:hypothetical protein MIND_00142600 [Mycena indigotica]|uniref:Ricin B lectin domain-containing protein n=1 Tax=Mycena indigotica TaxID=2126181 RepID=A0A8H6TIA3_9AGAR|nr:uncharacterized protein MIND_00142600 [Mycena indigotica]KAF7316240.1 hypothetical protein MIND_00142600 [Mycena indigotica]